MGEFTKLKGHERDRAHELLGDDLRAVVIGGRDRALTATKLMVIAFLLYFAMFYYTAPRDGSLIRDTFLAFCTFALMFTAVRRFVRADAYFREHVVKPKAVDDTQMVDAFEARLRASGIDATFGAEIMTELRLKQEAGEICVRHIVDAVLTIVRREREVSGYAAV